MAFAEVGAGTQRAAGGVNDDVAVFAGLAFPANVASGSLLIVGGAVWDSVGSITGIAVTDTLGTSYTTVLGTFGVGMSWRTFLAYGLAPSGGANTVTVDPSGANATFSGSFSIDEFSGAHATPADVDGGTTVNDDTSPAQDSITTVAADALIIGVMSHDGVNQALAAASGTLIGENEVNGGNQCHALSFQIVTTAQAYTVGFTMASNGPDASIQTHSFKPSVAGGSPTRGRVSFTELEAPFVVTRGRISFAELESPFAPTRGQISFAELESPLAPTKGRMSWVELEAPFLTTRGQISFAEFAIEDISTAQYQSIFRSKMIGPMGFVAGDDI